MGFRLSCTVLVAALILGAVVPRAAQSSGEFTGSREHPAIQYSTSIGDDEVLRLNRRLQSGEATLAFEYGGRGYLDSALRLLGLPLESQVLVFSKTSLQSTSINPTNPRAIFFKDSLAAAWIPGAQLLEVASQDPQRGMIFYALPQQPTFGTPQFRRLDLTCLTCHVSPTTLGVPGLGLASVDTEVDGEVTGTNAAAFDQRTPISQRWGGWFVNAPSAFAHRGRSTLPAAELQAKHYPSADSDLVALMVLAHQAHMTNLITRLGWEARIQAPGSGLQASGSGLQELIDEFVDYALFVDEAPLPAPVPSTPFARVFAAAGPTDQRGRSLREFDLRTRLFRYPCSYMIYTEAFDALPVAARDAVYARLWDILSGKTDDAKYRRLAEADRRTIIEILRETKTNLPGPWR